MTNLNFASDNAIFSDIAAMTSEKQYVALPLSLHPADELEALSAILAKLNPEFTPDYSTLSASTVRFKGGAYDRIYPASLISDNGGLAISFSTKMPIVSFEGLEVEIDFAEVNGYRELSMAITLDTGDDYHLLVLPLKLAKEFWGIDSDALKKLGNDLKRYAKKQNFEEVLKYLGSVGSGSSNVVDIKSLPELEPISVTNYKEVKTKFGMSYVLDIIVDGEPAQVWSPSNLKQILQAKPTLTNAELSYSTYTNSGGKVCVKGFLSGYESSNKKSALFQAING
jgi:hypothetical protein